MHFRVLTGLVLIMFALSACAPTKYNNGSKGRQTPASVNAQLAVEYMREGMLEAALSTFKKAIKQNPSYQPAHSSIAVLYERLGEDKLAEKHYRRAHSLNSKDPLTLNNYGQFLCRNERYDEADKMFTAALKDPLYRRPDKVLTNMGLCASRQLKQDVAIDYFRKALTRNSKYKPALREMARISFERKHWLGVRAYLQRLQEGGSLTPEFLWLGVQTEKELGDRDAMSSYTLLLKNRYPESEQTRLLGEWESAQSGR
ncbi:hypothetical protein MNBD_GAMMA15-1705 [hydrothermal vent metagenome]|uniref:Uncharacterized protein n=1 Tax=hydrothermal vent metagenome TaxID=652676 RepID=A0A3B0Z6U1_9ZZZZ